MADLFLFRSPVGHKFILISRRPHIYIDFLVCDTELIHILILISHRTHTYAYLPSDIYLCLSLKGYILIQISQRTYIGLILILVLRILYLHYRAYTCISDLIIVLQSLFLYFISYTCITELILVFQILYLYSGTYSCISDLILVFRILYLYYGAYSYITDTEVPVGTTEIFLVQSTPRYYITDTEVPVGTFRSLPYSFLYSYSLFRVFSYNCLTTQTNNKK